MSLNKVIKMHKRKPHKTSATVTEMNRFEALEKDTKTFMLAVDNIFIRMEWNYITKTF